MPVFPGFLEIIRVVNINIKNSRLEFVESSSHEVNKDNPEALAVLIYKFWKNNKEKKYG